MGDGANRRAVLEALGVDIWVLRDGSGKHVSGQSTKEAAPLTAVDPAQEAADRLRSSLAAGTRVHSDPGRTDPGLDERPEQASVTTGTEASGMDASPVAPFTVLCLSKGGALILIEPTDARAGRRFAVDVLSAVSGMWGGTVAQLAFEWPQPGLANNEATATRALAAFIGKQVSDNDDGITLMGGELVRRLSEVPDGCVILPPIDALMTEGDLKRTLWTELSSRGQ